MRRNVHQLLFGLFSWIFLGIQLFSSPLFSEETDKIESKHAYIQDVAITKEQFRQELSKYIHYTPGEPHSIGRIIIEDRQGGINQSTWLYVHAALNEYKKNKPICVILELNTPGGEVFAAQRISDALKDLDTQYDIPVIAYINNWAISAGAMLAYSCRFIVIAKDASMGAAEPVTFGEKGEMQEAPEKVNSALRTDFANRARFFGRNSAIAEAMVDKDSILVQRKGEIIKLNEEAQIQKEGAHPDFVIKPKGKLLTLTAEQLIEYGVADQMLLPLKHAILTDMEEATGVFPIEKSPLDQIEFFTTIAPCTIDTFQMDWQTRFLSFLSAPAVSSLLFLGMLIGFYVEMSTPGFGVGGVIGMLCLFFIILSSFALEAVHWLEPILLFFGLFLLSLEIFFFPTLGILAVFGTILTLVGLVGMMLPGLSSINFEGQTLNAAGDYVLSRLSWFSATFLLAIMIIAILSRYMTPRFRMMQKLVLQDTPMLATGIHAMQTKVVVQKTDAKIGEKATVVVTLRPAGRIALHGGQYDALSSGNFIEAGKSVTIIAIEGEKIIVEELFS